MTLSCPLGAPEKANWNSIDPTGAVHAGVPRVVVRARLRHADLRHLARLRRLHRPRATPQLRHPREVRKLSPRIGSDLPTAKHLCE